MSYDLKIGMLIGVSICMVVILILVIHLASSAFKFLWSVGVKDAIVRLFVRDKEGLAFCIHGSAIDHSAKPFPHAPKCVQCVAKLPA
jgi:hypothetical protein